MDGKNELYGEKLAVRDGETMKLYMIIMVKKWKWFGKMGLYEKKCGGVEW